MQLNGVMAIKRTSTQEKHKAKCIYTHRYEPNGVVLAKQILYFMVTVSIRNISLRVYPLVSSTGLEGCAAQILSIINKQRT